MAEPGQHCYASAGCFQQGVDGVEDGLAIVEIVGVGLHVHWQWQGRARTADLVISYRQPVLSREYPMPPREYLSR